MIDTIGMTDIGNGRPSNQDAYLLRQKEKNGKLYLLAVVCDGMGGLKKGEIASHYIVEVLKQWFDETLFDGLETMGIDMIEQNLIDLIRKINQNLLLMSRRMEETKSMGSTLTILFVEEHEFFVLKSPSTLISANVSLTTVMIFGYCFAVLCCSFADFFSYS